MRHHLSSIAKLLFRILTVLVLSVPVLGQDTSSETPESECIRALTIDQVYKEMTRIDSWANTPALFTNRYRQNDIYVSDANYKKIEEFIYDKLNDPVAFRDFLTELIKFSGETHSDKLPTRQAMVSVLKARLLEKGFRFESARSLIPREFYRRMSLGIIIEESDSGLLENGHGHDTHIIQLGYISNLVDRQFGAGTMIAFYKFVGAKDYFIWANLFDNPSVDHLGNPRNISSLLKPLGFQ